VAAVAGIMPQRSNWYRLLAFFTMDYILHISYQYKVFDIDLLYYNLGAWK